MSDTTTPPRGRTTTRRTTAGAASTRRTSGPSTRRTSGPAAARTTTSGPAAVRRTTARKATTRRATGEAARARRTPSTAPTAAPAAGTELPVRRDVRLLIGDVRAALDDLTLQLDLAGKEGRDRVRQQAAAVEERWTEVKNELGVARGEMDAALRTLRGAATDAARAALHVVDAARGGLKRR